MSDYEQPSGEGITDNDYVSRTGQKDQIPVVADENIQEGVVEGNVDPQADSDEQLVKDDTEAIDESNIIEERTRGATKEAGTYREPGDEEGLPSDTGVSSNR